MWFKAFVILTLVLFGLYQGGKYYASREERDLCWQYAVGQNFSAIDFVKRVVAQEIHSARIADLSVEVPDPFNISNRLKSVPIDITFVKRRGMPFAFDYIDKNGVNGKAVLPVKFFFSEFRCEILFEKGVVTRHSGVWIKANASGF